MRPRFFKSRLELRRWLERNHDKAAELLVGFRKKGSGVPGITWREAVDEALCFGWIDSIRRRIDDTSYTNRFTPRKPGSTWSRINIERAQELSELGLMRPAGLQAFQQRKEQSGIYSYEQRNRSKLDPAHERKLKANPKAWEFFQSKPPSYRQTAIWWVVSAKQEATRLRRLEKLIQDSAHGRTIPPLTR